MSPDPEVRRHKTKPPNTKNLSLQLDHTLNLQHIYEHDLPLHAALESDSTVPAGWNLALKVATDISNDVYN